MFIPLAFAGIALSWAVQIFFINQGYTWTLIATSLSSGQIHYLHTPFQTGITAAALVTAVAEVVRMELNRRAEKHLMAQRQEMTLASFENLRRQHEEVMMLRHDMTKHFRTLQSMSSETQIKDYLTELIGQSEEIRTVVRTGNETVDIILNSKISSARGQGITVEIQRVQTPKEIPMTDADLCSMMMNILDNAITAAGKAPEPYLLLDVPAELV